MTLLVRDEEDIIECNIDYHLSKGVDYIIATDNLSRDATPAILERYAQKGRLLLIRESDDDYAQHRWVTRMARLAATDLHADWVINNDADEFWWPDSGLDLKSCLAQFGPDVLALSVPRHNFPVLVSGTQERGPASREQPPREFHQTQTLRDTASTNQLGQPLPAKVCHRAMAQLEVLQGNHGAKLDGARLPTSPGNMSIFHFPLRHYCQFENKIRFGGAAYERNRTLPPQTGSAWRCLYREWLAGRLPAHYQGQIPDDQEIAQGLASGRYVPDRRLTTWLQALKHLDEAAVRLP